MTRRRSRRPPPRPAAPIRLLAGLLAGLVLAAAPARAEFPDRPLRIVSIASPGGTSDLLSRLLADAAAPVLGQRVVVENRTGANGLIAGEHVARGAADGYTLLQCPMGMMTISPELPGPRPPIDVAADLVPVANLAMSTYGVVVAASSPHRTLAEFIAAAKARPGALSYGSAGPGSAQHLSGERLERMAGIDMTHVPYRGAAPAVVDLVGGRIDLLITNLGDMVAQIRGGNLRLLAMGDEAGSPLFPDVPPASRTVPGLSIAGWFGLCGPRDLPAPALRAWVDAARRAMADDTVRQRLLENGLTPFFEDPDAFGRRIVADRRSWGEVIRAAGVQGQ